MSEDTKSLMESKKPAPTSPWTELEQTSKLAWLRKPWLWILGVASLLVAYVSVVWSSKKNGRAEALTAQLRDTLQKVDATKQVLSKLAEEKIALVAKIAEVQATRTHALEENLTDEEVLKRLKDQGLVKK